MEISMSQNKAVEHFITKTPWAIAGVLQENLLRTLANESSRLPNDFKFSIVTPMYNTPPRLLEELIWSCQAQTWRNWELILVDDKSPDQSHMATAKTYSAEDPRIKLIASPTNGGISGARNVGISAATGDWVGFLDHDDLLHPQALGVFARWIVQNPSVNFIYSNEVKMSEDSKTLDDFFYKPDFCHSTLLRSNYIAHLTFLRTDLASASKLPDGRYFRAEYDGVEDHDFFLRVSELNSFKAGHIPLFLYHWRRIPNSTAESLSAKPYLHERGLKLVRCHLAQRSLEANDVAGHLDRDGNRFLRVKFLDPNSVLRAKVLAIVPFKDGWHLTESCLNRLEEQTSVKVKCVLVDNNSLNPSTKEQLTAWLARPRRHEYILHEHPGAFNFAKINNDAFTRFGRDATHVLFLNNDVEMTDPQTLSIMISNLVYDPKIGFCGIRLDYPMGGGIQHGGIKFGLEMRGGPLFRTTHMTSFEEFVFDDHVVTAVTFACAMVRREVLEELGGLEESWLPNGFGDVDICLKAVRVGYKNFYLGSIKGTHHESKTRKDFCEDLEQIILYERNSDLIQGQMLRQLGYDSFVGLQTGASWFAKPLRYRLADRANNLLKSILGPFHRRLRSQWKQLEASMGPAK